MSRFNILLRWQLGNKRRPLKNKRSPTQNRPRRPNLRRMRQIIQKANFGHRFKLWACADLSSVSLLHDKSSWCETIKKWEGQRYNPFKDPINSNGASTRWKMRTVFRIPEQTPKRNTHSRILLDLWKNGRMHVRVEKNPGILLGSWTNIGITFFIFEFTKQFLIRHT